MQIITVEKKEKCLNSLERYHIFKISEKYPNE
jgi:hypothetical protein